MDEATRKAALLAKLAEWKQAADAMSQWQAIERQLRQECVALSGFNSPGSHNVDLDGTNAAKVQIKQNISLDKDHTKVGAMCAKLIANGLEPAIVNRLIRWKPDLADGEYKKRPEQYRAIVEEVLTVKPAMPSIEIVQPKR